MKTKTTIIVVSLFAMLILAVACFKKPPEREFGPVINLPRGMQNAEVEPAVLKESSVVVSVPVEKQFFVGPEQFPEDELSDRIAQLLKGQPEADQIVYVAGGYSVEYVDIVRVLDSARKADVARIGLLVNREKGPREAPSIFRVEIPAEPTDEEISAMKPDPLMLVVSISGKLGLQLNTQPMGATPDTANLTQTLTRVFQQRKEQRAYKPGMETRTDVPEDERVEKTIVVKAARTTNYGDVVRLIDAIKGVGANPIVLQIDALPE